MIYTLRSLIFIVLATVWTIPFGFVLGATCLIIPLSWRYAIVACWRWPFMGLVRYLLGISHEVRGLANLPNRPCIVYCKHQSAWETVALQTVFWPCVFVMKRELLWIPFLGWGFWAIRSISIDRSSGKSALKAIVDQGTKRYQDGQWIIIFPEGTRVAPGEEREFGIGGAILATQGQIPLLPVAHNAGECWGRNAFTKYPGHITLSIGPMIDPTGHTVRSINDQAAEWIRQEMQTLPSARHPVGH